MIRPEVVVFKPTARATARKQIHQMNLITVCIVTRDGEKPALSAVGSDTANMNCEKLSCQALITSARMTSVRRGQNVVDVDTCGRIGCSDRVPNGQFPTGTFAKGWRRHENRAARFRHVPQRRGSQRRADSLKMKPFFLN